MIADSDHIPSLLPVITNEEFHIYGRIQNKAKMLYSLIIQKVIDECERYIERHQSASIESILSVIKFVKNIGKSSEDNVFLVMSDINKDIIQCDVFFKFIKKLEDKLLEDKLIQNKLLLYIIEESKIEVEENYKDICINWISIHLRRFLANCPYDGITSSLPFRYDNGELIIPYAPLDQAS